MSATATVTISGLEIVMTRFIAAERARVFAAWTERDQVDAWWGADGYRTTTHEMDVRPGGRWRITMDGPGGTGRAIVTYREVVAPSRLVYDHSGDPEGTPPRFRTTVTFEEQDGGTLITMRSAFATAGELREVYEGGAAEGGPQMMARLAAFIEAGR